MTGTQLEIEPIARQLPMRPQTAMELLNVALQNNSAIDVIERLAALHEKAEAKAAEDHFNQQMCLVQGKVEKVCPDLKNNHTGSKYASYAALNGVIRPVYVEHGFSVSFSEEEGTTPDFVRIVAYVSNGGHTRIYRKSMPVDTAGPKGTQIVNKPQGSAIAESYAKRYLLKDIFNIAIGEEDTDGNTPSGPDMEGLDDYCDAIREAQNFEDMDKAFRQGYSAASSIKSEKAKAALAAAREDWRKRTKGAK